jgi:lysophospholipase L1-like esterase
VKYGCPGESTATYLGGSCPRTATGGPLHDAYTGTPRDAALAFLRSHRGKVDVVTLSLWGNDANAFLASCNGDVRCIVDGAPAAIATTTANLSTILSEIHRAAPDVAVVLLGAADTRMGPVTEVSRPLIGALNAAMADAAAANRARFADLFGTFNPDGDQGAALCVLTLLCSDRDGHPSDAGYRAIAGLVEAALEQKR